VIAITSTGTLYFQRIQTAGGGTIDQPTTVRAAIGEGARILRGGGDGGEGMARLARQLGRRGANPDLASGEEDGVWVGDFMREGDWKVARIEYDAQGHF
jgi:hypothetical protein